MSTPRTAPIAFVDSSAIVALIDRDDSTHAAALDAYQSLVADGYRLFTTNQVMAETYELVMASMGAGVARQCLRDINLAVYVTDAQDEERAREMIVTGGDPQPLTVTDALSRVVMDRLGVADAFAVDPQFFVVLG